MERVILRLGITFGVLALLLVSAPVASADVIANTNGTGVGLSVTVHSNGSILFANGSNTSIDTVAESFWSTIDGVTITPTWCVDLGYYSGTETHATVSVFGGTMADQNGNMRDIGAAGWILSNYSGFSLADLASFGGLSSLNQNEANAALAMAIWKAAYDPTHTTLASNGGGSILWFTGADANAIQVAQAMINKLDSNSTAVNFLNFQYPPLYPSNQDQIWVPEPSLIILLGIGLGAISLIASRFRN